MKCPKCNGMGRHNSAWRKGDTFCGRTILCPECLGSGRIPTDEIIQCAECANVEVGMASDGFIYAGCKVWGGLVRPHDFCSRAVKREET